MPASGIIFSGNDVKTLKSNIDLNGNAKIMSGTVDPTSVATSAPEGSLYLNTANGLTYRKTDNGSSTNWAVLFSGAAPGTGVIIANAGVLSTLPMTDAQIVIAGATGVPNNMSVSGGATLSNLGVLTLSNTAVTGQPITGYVSGAGTVSASDSILQALQKINGNDALKMTNPMTTGGDIVYGGASGTPTRLANGSNGQMLTSAGGTSAPTWTTPFTNPMTTGGDVIYGGASGVATRLANGSNGQVLTSSGGTTAPTWTTPGAGTVYNWAGYHAATVTWPTTSASFVTPTDQATGDITQTDGSNMTVTAYKNGSNFWPGITWTPDSATSKYLITCTIQSDATIAQDVSVSLLSFIASGGGTNDRIDWQSYRTVTGAYYPVKLTAIMSAQGAVPMVVTVQVAITGGTMNIRSNGAVASQPPVRWTVNKIN